MLGIGFLVSGLIMIVLGVVLNMSMVVLGVRIGFGLIGTGLILLVVGSMLRGLADSIGIVWYTLLIAFIGIAIGVGMIKLGLTGNFLPSLVPTNSTVGVQWG